MMYFNTDPQTLNDLTIFGKPGAESVFSLFDRTQTRGGAIKLEELFRYPMADPEKINERTEILKYFSTTDQEFPFKRELFDVIELYMDNRDERTKLPVKETSVTEKLSVMVAADPQIKIVKSGVNAIRELYGQIETFVAKIASSPLSTSSTQHAFITDLAAMKQLLSDVDFKELSGETKKNLPYGVLARYDAILRFRKQDEMRICLYAIYQLDACLSVAKVAQERGFCYPLALMAETQKVELDEVYHPHVKSAVANSLQIDPEGNVIFLTGANMAGKSTLMKSLGIAMYLAHMGFPVPAKKMSFAVREGIYTSINLPDNLNKGISHFYAEVLRIKKVSRELGHNKNLFVIIDELFRGTNVKDAYEATVAITSAFAGKRNCMFVVSTHIMEAGDTLRGLCDNINFVYLPTKMDGKRPVYTYRLEQGITADRHGMIIVQNEGILELLNRAKIKPN